MRRSSRTGRPRLRNAGDYVAEHVVAFLRYRRLASEEHDQLTLVNAESPACCCAVTRSKHIVVNPIWDYLACRVADSTGQPFRDVHTLSHSARSQPRKPSLDGEIDVTAIEGEDPRDRTDESGRERRQAVVSVHDIVGSTGPLLGSEPPPHARNGEQVILAAPSVSHHLNIDVHA